MILVDYRNVAIACASQELKQTGGLTDLTAHYILKKLASINAKFGPKYGEMVLCNDYGSWRYDEFEHYKAKRRMGSKDEGYLVTLELLDELFDDMRDKSQWHCIRIKGVEADDIMAGLCLLDDKPSGTLDLGDNDSKHLVVSADKDLVQCVMRGADVYNPVKKKMAASKNPERDLRELIIKGDTIDGIPNIISDDDTFIVEGKRQRPMRKPILEALLDAPDINAAIDGLSVNGIDNEQIKTNYVRNHKLIDLREIPIDVINGIHEHMAESSPQTNSFRMMEIMSKYRLASLMGSVGDFKLHKKEL